MSVQSTNVVREKNYNTTIRALIIFLEVNVEKLLKTYYRILDLVRSCIQFDDNVPMPQHILNFQMMQ